MRLKRSHYFLAISAIPLVIALQNPRVSEHIHIASATLFKPALVAGNTLARGISNVKGNMSAFVHNMREYKQTQGRMLELEARDEVYQETLRENKRLKELLEFKTESGHKTIAGRVIAREFLPLRKTVLLDKGTVHGIKKDMAVIVPQGLVGRAIEVGPVTTRVLLLTDPQSRVSGMEAETRAHGVVSGNGSDRLDLRYIDLDSGIAVGETILTSGVTQLFPKGIRVGAVESITKDSDGLHLVAKVRPFTAFSKLEEVLCIVSFQAE